MAVGHFGNLEMPHPACGQVLGNLGTQIAFDDLAVEQVHLHLHIRSPYRLHDAVRVVLAVEVKARHAAGVDGLHQHIAPCFGRFCSGPLQVADEGGVCGISARTIRA